MDDDGPEAMRSRLADYVYALHRAYLTHLGLLAPAERAAMPLSDRGGRGPVTVAVAAARDLHLVATTDPLPAPRGPEVELTDEFEGVSWRVRFFDASLLPELGIVGASGDDPQTVRRVLGVTDVIYHLSVSPGEAWGPTTRSTPGWRWPTSTPPRSATESHCGTRSPGGRPGSTSSRWPSGSA